MFSELLLQRIYLNSDLPEFLYRKLKQKELPLLCRVGGQCAVSKTDWKHCIFLSRKGENKLCILFRRLFDFDGEMSILSYCGNTDVEMLIFSKFYSTVSGNAVSLTEKGQGGFVDTRR